VTKKVFLGMSGGVDSSVSAALLKRRGYEVVGVYMKNWSVDLPGHHCPWAEDLADAKRVATWLDIDFRVFDFEKSYKKQVVDKMIAQYKRGYTPNPDIICNEKIKFDLFYKKSMSMGADFIATGHYARTDGESLLVSADANKDQTYFLYRIAAGALGKTLFPIGDLTKPEVKRMALELNLPVAQKKESMGICFVGKTDIKNFLAEYIAIDPGEIRDLATNQILGYHEGAAFYTLGQRHGLYLGGGLPYYVAGKDLSTNIIYVTTDLNAGPLWASRVELSNVIARHKVPVDISVRLRHRAPLLRARLRNDVLLFDSPVRRPSSGQSAVFYHGRVCLGGGIIK
jgi:tRNA-specific 2-thiouridylase